MKKSLSVLLSAALAFGAFASVASAADSSLTTQQKFDELKAKGVFAGYADGQAHLDDNLQRAQAARIVALLLGAEGIGDPDTKVVTEKPFPDVDLGKWYTEEVAAVKELGAMSGNADGTFNPNGNLTNQEVAALVGQVLKLEPVEGAKVDGAADWAAGYIKALQDKGFTVPTPYTAAATRGALVEASYYADSVLNPAVPEKVSVTSAKATGVKKVSVTLDKAVDTSKATLTLKRGTATVATKTTWAEDGKSATLELTSSKISAADYSVTLGGLSTSDIATATASFTATDEAVTKIEFVTASDDIALSTAAKIKLRAENQYGEDASFPAASYTVNAPAEYAAQVKNGSDGSLYIQLNTGDAANVTPGFTQIPIYVFNNDNHVTVSKTFKLGFAPFVSKLEIGEPKYSNGGDSLKSKDETVTFALTLYDQYGNPVTATQKVKNTDTDPIVKVPSSFNSFVSPYTESLDNPVFSADGDDFSVSVKLKSGSDKAATHSLTVYVGSASKTADFKVGTSKVATSVEWDTYDGVLAEGDDSITLTLNAYDAEGNKLSAQEIADDSRIKVTSSAGSASIVKIGPDKGKVSITGLSGNLTEKSILFVTASILTINTNTVKSYQIPVLAKRVPSSIILATKPADKAVSGASSDFDFSVLDQYGVEIGTTAGYTVDVTPNLDSANTGVTLTGTTGTGVAIDNVNDGYTFSTNAAKFGKASVTATLKKGTDEIGSVTAKIEAIDPATPLNYSLADITSLYAAVDSGLMPDAAKSGGVVDAVYAAPHKALSLTVKDNGGNTVAYPDKILSVSSSNTNVVYVGTDANVGYVLGKAAGEATVSAVVEKANGETTTLTAKVTVKADPVTISSFAADNSSVDVDDLAGGTADGKFAYDIFGNLTAKDQYGVEYKNGTIYTYDKLLGVRYTVSDTNNVTVVINAATGQITSVTAKDPTKPYEFVITATAPNGTTKSVLVYKN